VRFVPKSLEGADDALNLVPVGVVSLLYNGVVTLLTHVPSKRCTGDYESLDTSVTNKFSGQHPVLWHHWYSNRGSMLVKSL